MPQLENRRHELFALGLAKGLTQDQAYIEAGYDAEPGQSARAAASLALTNFNEIGERVRELQGIAALVTGFDTAKALTLALEDRHLARQLGQMGPAVSATRLASDLKGLVVTKSLNINADIEISPDELETLRAIVHGSPSVPMIDAAPQGSPVVSDADVVASDVPESS